MGYNANKMTTTQRTRISEIRDRYSKMGVDKTNDELLEIAKQAFPKQFPKKMKDGGAVCRGMGAAMRGGKFKGVS